jgi:hypothetical protein
MARNPEKNTQKCFNMLVKKIFCKGFHEVLKIRLLLQKTLLWYDKFAGSRLENITWP